MAMVGAGLLGALYIPFTLDYTARGDTTAVVFGIAVMPMAALSVAGLVPHMLVRRRTLPRTTRIRAVDATTAIRPRRRVLKWLRAPIGAAVAGHRTPRRPALTRADAAAGGATIGLRSDLRPWVRPLMGSWLLIAAVILAIVVGARTHYAALSDNPLRAGLALLTSVEPIIVIAGCVAVVHFVVRGEFFLALTPDGVVQRAGTVTQFLAWDDIAAVQALLDLGERRKIRVLSKVGTSVTVTGGRRPLDRLLRKLTFSIDVEPPGYGLDPALLFHLLSFYRLNREARAELATDAAIDRILSGALIS
ncbi:hypothetical protein [Nocardia blacklockiae]|uniref:hypothetical protein n=1 Tax=Nocardia blacklockiae TaxID=480036 RepID=UPI0018960BFD|nr:hypothetical protein [Nocardia blacklockiae]MBF6171066.1 hypothetical protein [Nocardia blacklockiae]